MEAAFEWGIRLDEWRLIHPITRAQMVSLYIHRGQREAFINDWSLNQAKAKGNSKGKDDGYDRLMKQMH